MNVMERTERTIGRYGRTVSITGAADDGYYLYIGPSDRELRGGTGYLVCAGESYTVDKAETVYAGDEAVYIWAVLRKAVLC